MQGNVRLQGYKAQGPTASSAHEWRSWQRNKRSAAGLVSQWSFISLTRVRQRKVRTAIFRFTGNQESTKYLKLSVSPVPSSWTGQGPLRSRCGITQEKSW